MILLHGFGVLSHDEMRVWRTYLTTLDSADTGTKLDAYFVAFRGFVALLALSQSSEAVLGNGWLL
jgi:hypothetical protein